MSKLKIIFFGTPRFALDSLQEINLNYNVEYIVTAPDKKSGRGQKINESEVKQYAKKKILRFYNLKILITKSLLIKLKLFNQI